MHKKYQSKITFLTQHFWLRRAPSSGKLLYKIMGAIFFQISEMGAILSMSLGNPGVNKCIYLTKNNFKLKGCFSKLFKLRLEFFFPAMNKKLYNRLTFPSSECYYNTDLCNGSGKFSKKSQIFSTITGVVFVLFKLF